MFANLDIDMLEPKRWRQYKVDLGKDSEETLKEVYLESVQKAWTTILGGANEAGDALMSAELAEYESAYASTLGRLKGLFMTTDPEWESAWETYVEMCEQRASGLATSGTLAEGKASVMASVAKVMKFMLMNHSPLPVPIRFPLICRGVVVSMTEMLESMLPALHEVSRAFINNGPSRVHSTCQRNKERWI